MEWEFVWKPAVLLVTAGLLLPPAAVQVSAQAGRGRLYGSIHDASGAAIPRATVIVSAAGSDRKEIIFASEAGEYDFPSLPEGAWRMEVLKRGFALLQKSGVAVGAGAANRLDVTLEIGRVSETLEVVAQAPPPSPPSTGAPRRIRVGGNVQATKLVAMPKPAYPESARQAGVEGTVLMQAVISTGGSLLGLSALNTMVDPELAKAAMEAVSGWRYEPTLLNGVPVEVITTITVNFRLAR